MSTVFQVCLDKQTEITVFSVALVHFSHHYLHFHNS